MIEQSDLERLYSHEKLSVLQAANHLGCSEHTVRYWMKKYAIKKRSISDAIYVRKHPNGDPFSIQPLVTQQQAILHGIGIGLYWGEGTKANKYAVRLGNSDPELLKTFMRFLIELYAIDSDDLRFGLQIFTDIETEDALQFWMQQLSVKRSQFYKIIVTISGSLGTYRHKSKYGVVTIYYHNKKLRDIIVGLLPR